MPGYKEMNSLAAYNELPDFFWTGRTEMNCIKQVVMETKVNAYAHHIQRLMIIGNFALLTGLDPKAVSEWFLIVYMDALEWVELPNVYGMALFADGGLFASKPYAAGGSYINKMSNYCQNCSHSVTKKNGEDACPFNYLYWDFLIRNSLKLSKNPRIAMMYKTISKMEGAKIAAIKSDSAKFLQNLK
jgi:deoxyribodipyrimidine photolyase-related protein